MAKKPVPVTEEDYKKDPENVQRIETRIPGFPDAEPLVTYIRVETLDDVTGKPSDKVETVPLLVPVLKTREEVTTNEDGPDEVKTVEYWDFEPRELDLSDASIKKLATALKPYSEKSRERSVQVRPAAAKSSGGPLHDLAAIRDWAKKAGHEVADKGRIPGKIIDAYYKATGKPRPDGD